MQKPARKQGLNIQLESYALAHARASAKKIDHPAAKSRTPPVTEGYFSLS